ncbi:hypothetical protein HK104_011503, partial [Borealophlyctis nickersoniae]
MRRWTLEEDKILIQGVEEAKAAGKRVSWVGIGKSVGKSGTRVQERWQNVLAPGLKFGDFCAAEDVQLQEARQAGQPLVEIARQLNRAPRAIHKRLVNLTYTKRGQWTRPELELITKEIELRDRLLIMGQGPAGAKLVDVSEGL